ncbi:hypothetical protein ANN_10117 [Periplaneta americana]|uniref:Uncharacterized protein n=1 Tax=Periplaneta americana TaxID=6978 RepID=A0ABQ8TN97_PERAM|nr:hypothetical protein ANN_10117 [Periplaneta americana]
MSGNVSFRCKTPWPPRSPDLTSLDFFLWGHMKNLVYDTPVESEEDLLARVLAAAESIHELEKHPPETDLYGSKTLKITLNNLSFEEMEKLLEASKDQNIVRNGDIKIEHLSFEEMEKLLEASKDQNIVRNGDIKIEHLSFEEVEKLKYLGATVTNLALLVWCQLGQWPLSLLPRFGTTPVVCRRNERRRVSGYGSIFYILPLREHAVQTKAILGELVRDEEGLRVFENKVLRKIFGAKRDEVTGEWRKLHNTELHALYSSPYIIRNIKSRRLRWAGHVARMGESRNAYSVLVGRPEVKRPLGRPRRRWEDNIKMDLREVGYDDREWINLAQDRD